MTTSARTYTTPWGSIHAPYADLYIGCRRETWPIRGQTLARKIQHAHFLREGALMKPAALAGYLANLEAEAEFGGAEREVFLRAARHGDRLYIDLCDSDWRAIELDHTDWRLVEKPPVRFVRSASMRALPEPVLGGSIYSLWKFVRVADEGDRTLVVSHLLSVLIFTQK